MAASTIANIIQPETFAPYVAERSLTNWVLFQTGAVVSDPALDAMAQEGGYTVQLPNWSDLSGASEVLNDDGSALTVNAITAAKQIARKIERGKAFGASDLSAQRSGDDPLGFAANRVGRYWSGQFETMAIYSATGVFLDNVNDSSDLIYDCSSTTSGTKAAANKFCKSTLPLALTKAGDQMKEYSIIWTHSAAFADMISEELIDTVRITDENIDTDIPRYAGKYMVVVDDNLPSETDGTTGYTNYTSYILKPGAFMFAEARCDMPIEIQREGLKSETYLITRRNVILHPVGFSFISGSVSGKSATNAELALAANWNRVWSKGNTGLIKVVHNCSVD